MSGSRLVYDAVKAADTGSGRNGARCTLPPSRGAFVQRLHLNSGDLPCTTTSNDLGPAETATANPDDLHSMSQLLELLERKLDKHIDESRHVSPIPSIAIDKERTDIERLEMTSSIVYHLQRYAETNHPFISIGTRTHGWVRRSPRSEVL